MKSKKALLAYALLALSPITYAASSEAAVEANAAPAEKAEAPKAAPEKGAPLPLLTIDGVGGVVLTPIAYLVNPGAEGTEIGLPSIGATYVNARQKNVFIGLLLF